jgi:hypothetical protein
MCSARDVSAHNVRALATAADDQHTGERWAFTVPLWHSWPSSGLDEGAPQ